MYPSAVELAKYIVTKCYKDGEPISNLQLQKILYYIQKDFLLRGDRAFYDELEAWQFGPVVPNVYYTFCGFGAMPIAMSYKQSDFFKDDYYLSVVNAIVNEKRRLDPWELVDDTHKKGGAWDRIYAGGEGNHHVIPVDLIKEAG